MKTLKLIIAVLLILSPMIFPQQELGGGWKLNGQIQLRTELDGRDFSNSTHPLTFASMRTRLGVEKSFEEVVSFLVQFQDSRVFGEEPNTLTPIDNIDLHQGFLKLNKLFDWDWQIQAGRFEVAYGTERFFGAVGWHYVGRSFDGVRFTILPETWKLDLFGLTIDESVNYIANATPGMYLSPGQPTPSRSIYGFWKQNTLTEKSKFDLFGYYEIDRTEIAEDTCFLNMFTLGGSYWGNYDKLSIISEAAFQFGDMLGRDLSAYLFSLSGNYSFDEAKLGLGFDLLSGTDSDDFSTSMNTFQPAYGTNHKFYGYMDYFINVATNTGNLGLNDFYLIGNFSPENSKWSFDANLHHFMSNKSSAADQNTFGQELDLTVKFNLIKGTTLSWGGSLFFPGELMKSYYGNEDVAYWTYLMITANI